MASQSPAVKYHFWILFIATPVFIVLAFVLMWAMVGGALAKAKEDFNSAKSGLGGPVKSAGDLKAVGDKVGALEEDRKTLWQQSYEEQKAAGVFRWPVSSANLAFNNELPFVPVEDGKPANPNGPEEKKFGDKFTLQKRVTEPPVLKDAFDKAYAELEKGNEKTGAVGIAPTRYAGGAYWSVLRSVTDWGTIAAEPEPFWLALEDYWVQRGLLAPIAKVNAAAAEFADVTPKDAAGAELKRNLRTRTWDLDLEVETKGPKQFLKGELRNRTARLQPLGVNKAMKVKVWFKVPQGLAELKKELANKSWLMEPDQKSQEARKVQIERGVAQFKWPAPDVLFEIRGESVQGKAALACSPQEINVNTVAEIARVVQVFDEATVPVRLVNTIELNTLDHRNRAATLELPKHIEADEASNPTTPTDPAGSPGAPGMPPGLAGGGGPRGGGPDGEEGPRGPGATGGAGVAGRKTGNAAAVLLANKMRYLKRTDDVRRMPVGVAVVIDNDYTNDLMVAYTNSPLRFQITQTQWARYKGTLPGVGGAALPPSTGPGVPGVPGVPLGGRGGRDGDDEGSVPGMPPGVGPGFPGGPGGTVTGTSGALPGEANSNLCEFALFGIVSLYEKVPAKTDDEKKKDEEGKDGEKKDEKKQPDPMNKPDEKKDEKKPDDGKKDPTATPPTDGEKKAPAAAPTAPGK